jgi:hypothetical protein
MMDVAIPSETPRDGAENSPRAAEDAGSSVRDAAGDAAGDSVGDLVVLPVPRVREQVGCGERVGVVLEDRRNVVKVLFPDIDRAFWIDRAHVLAIDEGRLPTHPLARRLHRLCRRLDAVAVEVYDREGDADVFYVFTRGTTLEAVESARAELGADFRRVGIDPGGVRRARLTFVFRTASTPTS